MGKPVGPKVVSLLCNSKQILPNGKFHRRLTCTRFAQRESGTSLTIGAGSGTGRKSSEETQFSFEYSGCEFGVPLKTFRLF